MYNEKYMIEEVLQNIEFLKNHETWKIGTSSPTLSFVLSLSMFLITDSIQCLDKCFEVQPMFSLCFFFEILKMSRGITENFTAASCCANLHQGNKFYPQSAWDFFPNIINTTINTIAWNSSFIFYYYDNHNKSVPRTPYGDRNN